MIDKGSGSAQFPNFGKESTQSMLNMQKELLDAYEQASRAWLDRVKSETEFWSDLATKLSTTKNVSEALAAYQQSVAQRMQMAADDGRRLFEECQKISQKLGSSLPKPWPTGST